MRLALITTDNREDRRDYTPEKPWFGTAPQALLDGFATLSEEVEVHVLSCARERLKSPLQLASNIRFHSVHVPAWAWLKLGYLGNIFAIRRCLREIKPDVVHGQGTERDCAMAAVFSGYLNILTIHGNMAIHAERVENRGNLYLKVASRLERLALRRTDGVVSISSYTEQLINSHSSRSWLLPNAVDPMFFGANRVPQDPPVLLFVGSLDERKNPLGFISACGNTIAGCGWRVRLCGEGDPSSPYFRKLEKLAVENPWIELVGWKSRVELLGEMERASLLVLPTLEDNCPMVVLEAMAAGLPVAASRSGGIPELITDGETGRLFDPLDHPAMCEIIRSMMTEPQRAMGMAENARRKARSHHDPREVAQRHLDVYREVLEGPSSEGNDS